MMDVLRGLARRNLPVVVPVEAAVDDLVECYEKTCFDVVKTSSMFEI